VECCDGGVPTDLSDLVRRPRLAGIEDEDDDEDERNEEPVPSLPAAGKGAGERQGPGGSAPLSAVFLPVLQRLLERAHTAGKGGEEAEIVHMDGSGAARRRGGTGGPAVGRNNGPARGGLVRPWHSQSHVRLSFHSALVPGRAPRAPGRRRLDWPACSHSSIRRAIGGNRITSSIYLMEQEGEGSRTRTTTRTRQRRSGGVMECWSVAAEGVATSAVLCRRIAQSRSHARFQRMALCPWPY
jgi:hypothetical protein